MTSYEIPDSPKMLRETLCVAQTRIGNADLDGDRKLEHIARLQRLTDECDRHRPLGPDGKHGDRHTPTCGCEDAPELPKAWANLFEALELLAKHQSNEISPFHCEHDQLTVMADPNEFTDEEIARLDELGFTADVGQECFYSFRYGSA